MRITAWPVLFALLGIAAAMWGVGAQVVEAEGPPPLVVDTTQPLQLDEPPPPEPFDPFAIPTGPKANNQACFACHANYEKEPFVNWHAEANVGCVKCHGPSSDHRNDENNITPPDKIFGPGTIAKLCKDCHDDHDAPAADVIARWQERCPVKTKADEIVCTDCHGQHRLKFRTVWWDKETRELVIRKEGQRVKFAPDLTLKKSDEPAANSTPP
ncbi:MAG TPA: hypothetical protein VE890_01635 [Thermoguttaceae bacterium]|nr:hypothetical protein [Thermoguttaceae bacterium]